MSNQTLVIERTFQAPAAAVFDAWTSEEVMRRWFHAEHEWETTEAQVDLRLGGSVRVVMRDPANDISYGGGGHYTVIDPPTRLAFTWTWDDEYERNTLIELDFSEADGSTTVRLTHSNLRDRESVLSHEDGWTKCLDNLERALAAGPGVALLYWYPGTCSRVTLIALEQIGAPFETRLVNKPVADELEYLRLNPKGKVPALVIDGTVLTETPAIQTYLHRRHPDVGLLPGAAHEIAALELLSWFAAGIHPALTRQRLPQQFCDEPAAFESIAARARAQLEEAFAIVERRLPEGGWLFGEWTVLDGYLLWLWFRATGSGMDGSAFPRCADHARRCEQRPAVSRALDREEMAQRQLEAEGRVSEPLPYMAGRAPVG